MLIATHEGSFHADEVFAIAALGLLGDAVEVVRTRDRDAVADADLRVDVGFRDDASSGDFDHHQRDFDAARDNSVRYASFGLIWREFGERVCGGDQAVAAAVDAALVQAVDANDTGQQLTQSLVDGVHPMTVNAIIGGFNARWDETLTPEQERERFNAAVALAQGILAREVASAASGRRAERIVREAIAAAPDPRVVELPVNAPWKQVLVPEAAEAQFVIYPKRQGFGLEAVPREPGSFQNRRDLPSSWGGLEGADLVAATGVEDALFCHAKRFLAVARLTPASSGSPSSLSPSVDARGSDQRLRSARLRERFEHAANPFDGFGPCGVPLADAWRGLGMTGSASADEAPGGGRPGVLVSGRQRAAATECRRRATASPHAGAPRTQPGRRAGLPVHHRRTGGRPDRLSPRSRRRAPARPHRRCA